MMAQTVSGMENVRVIIRSSPSAKMLFTECPQKQVAFIQKICYAIRKEIGA